jgi:hypothetical protein
MSAAIPSAGGLQVRDHRLPGGTSTQIFSLNNSGEAVGQAAVGTTTISFAYNSKKGKFTVLPNVPGAAITYTPAINNAESWWGVPVMGRTTAASSSTKAPFRSSRLRGSDLGRPIHHTLQ